METVKREVEFKPGRMSLKGDSRERLSKTAPTPKTIEKCLISCWVIGEEGDEMAEAGEISEGRVQKSHTNN
ncbi:hypothetical protein TNCV_851051 [Trichonephila clavipes]|nr:hypothetical protein TNCV_851051 [Trichonephila clavipes]